MSLKVAVLSANDLPNLPNVASGVADTIDPYVELTLRGEKYRTKHKLDNQNPKWNEDFSFDLRGEALKDDDVLTGVIFDYENVGSKNRLVGEFTHNLRDVIHVNEVTSVQCKVRHKYGKSTGAKLAKVNLEIRYIPPEEDIKGEVVSVDNLDVEEGVGASVEPQSSHVSISAGASDRSLKRKDREQLSKKPQNFVTRIKIWEGRQLVGRNIHPLCKVSIAGHTKATRVKKSTNRPFWDEYLVFTLNTSPAELVNEVINFQVLNSRGKLRRDAIIGNFQMDVGTIYEEKDHSILNKWLALSNGDHCAAVGAAGYLLVSMCVIGKGDRPPQFKKAAETDHIESNLLRPAGTEQQTGELIIKIFKAEDIPQMDSLYFEKVKRWLTLAKKVKKDHVDPYMVVSFAGKEVKTEVITGSSSPEWNEEFCLPVTFPSMCERIKLQMKDWDGLTEHDCIGTTYIDMSSISSPGNEGFLPTFGPSFVNFYGSTREFSHLPDKYDDLNQGKGTGVAYRGRVMMSIKMKVVEHNEEDHHHHHHHRFQKINTKEVERVRNMGIDKYTYRLYCSFLDSTMVSISDKPVKFEVSIGNYGYKLGEDEVVGETQPTKFKKPPSTTHPIKPEKGGEYHFIPWTVDEKKPVVVIDSDWENIYFRLKVLNTLLKKINYLHSRLDKARISIQNNKADEAREELRAMIKELPSVCRSGTESDSGAFNDLDNAKFARREQIAADAEKMLEDFDSIDVDVAKLLNDAEEHLNLLQETAMEPQNSLPDVIIWMISGKKRVAFHRIPAYHLLYSDDEDARGKLCNKIHSFFLECPGILADNYGNIGTEIIGARLRVRLWLGLEKDAKGSKIGVFEKMEKNEMSVPRLFLREKMTKYKLRVFLYQARNLLALDSDGLSDPFAKVSFLSQSQKSSVLNDTLCPVWNQQFIFDDVLIPGIPTDENLPNVCIEVFDSDRDGLKSSDDFLGRCLVPVMYNKSWNSNSDNLAWQTVYKDSDTAGEILILCELFPESGQASFPPLQVEMEPMRVEVLCWGVRNMQKYQLSAITSPSVEFEINGKKVLSKVNRNIKVHPNFSDALLIFNSIELPKNKLYMPSVNIKVRDHRGFGRKPIVGSACVTDLTSYISKPKPSKDDDGQDISTDLGVNVSVAPTGKGAESDSEVTDLTEDEIDWWSKYYASKDLLTREAKAYMKMGFNKLTIYNAELEKVGGYDGFKDVCKTIKLYHGKHDDGEDRTAVGELKANFRTYSLSEDAEEPGLFTDLPLSITETEEYVIRVYIVKGINLQPKDTSQQSDPYIKIELGNMVISDEDNYIANNCNPVFGKMYEVKTTQLPVHKDLKVSVWDFDLIDFDDLIGETIIDLENRVLTKYRATCGLPQSYSLSGPNKWRDSRTPKKILTEYYRKISNVNTDALLNVDGKSYNLEDFLDAVESGEIEDIAGERSALNALRKLDLVKEHIETRPIYNPLLPGIEQGKLEMFVDIFPLMNDRYLPPPIDISPRKHRRYELRCVIWNVTGIKLDETTVFGETMSDIYVKGWLADPEESQSTDVHYRSFDGTGNFNWRFVFPFEYNPQKKKVVVRKKEYFWSADEREYREVRPDLRIQILEDDLVSADDWLGSLELQLDDMLLPTKKREDCGKPGKQATEKISLFKHKRVKGWWVCKSKDKGINTDTDKDKKKGKGKDKKEQSKIEMTVELLTAEEAAQRPAGQGQEEPNANPKLPPPERPATSFLWFLSPWKTLKYIIWRNLKWYIIGFFLVLLGIVGFLFFLIIVVVRIYLCR